MDLSTFPHPKTAFFHVFFKVAAVVTYLMCTIFVSAFVFNFISVVTLLAIDFWTVKNISGRLMVGLRWWNEISEEGQSHWKFESLGMEGLKKVHAEESLVFWYALYLTPVTWSVLGLVAVIKLELDYLMIVAVALSLSIANIVGYTKCSKEAKERISKFASATLQSGVSSILGGISSI